MEGVWRTGGVSKNPICALPFRLPLALRPPLRSISGTRGPFGGMHPCQTRQLVVPTRVGLRFCLPHFTQLDVPRNAECTRCTQSSRDLQFIHAVAGRLEAIATRLEAIASRLTPWRLLETVTLSTQILDQSFTKSISQHHNGVTALKVKRKKGADGCGYKTVAFKRSSMQLACLLVGTSASIRDKSFSNSTPHLRLVEESLSKSARAEGAEGPRALWRLGATAIGRNLLDKS